MRRQDALDSFKATYHLGYKRKGEQEKMCKMDMIKKIEELQSWENLMEEAKAEIESIKDTIKTEMLKENSEEMEVGKYIVRYTNVTSNRFDSASFKKALPEIYKIYLKQSVSRRFSISA